MCRVQGASRTVAGSSGRFPYSPYSTLMNDMHEALHHVQGTVNRNHRQTCAACTGGCASCKIAGMASRRDQLEEAGRWLRDARERRGHRTAADFARALDVDQSLVSRYERGISAVGDERAEQIAEVLRMDIVDVRRGLGLWVPREETARAARPGSADDAELQDLIAQAGDNPALRDALLAVKRMNEMRSQPSTGRADDRGRRAG
jgi:transcriptional regulator with XRE-family HTH domain